MKREKRPVPINPLYIKNEKGQKKSVYLSIKAYKEILKEIKEYYNIKKRLDKKK